MSAVSYLHLVVPTLLHLTLAHDRNFSHSTIGLARETYLHPEYDKNAVPVHNISEPITIYLGLSLRKILEVDEFDQLVTMNIWVRLYWRDEYIVWDSDHFLGRTKIQVDDKFIWRPDIALYSDGAGDYSPTMDSVQATITNEGNVSYLYPALYKVACRMDIMYFPFDQQKCAVQLGSWIYDASVINLQLRPHLAADYTDYQINTAWRLINFTARNQRQVYGCCKGKEYVTNIYEITIRRHWQIHFFYMLIPILLIQFLSVLQFLLPCDSGEKVSLGITIYLSMLVYLLMVSEMLPSTEKIPLIVRYIVSTLIIVAIAQMITIIVLMIHHNGSHDNHSMLPHWARILFLHMIARVLGMSRYITSDDEHHERLQMAKKVSRLDMSTPGMSLKEVDPETKPNYTGSKTVPVVKLSSSHSEPVVGPMHSSEHGFEKQDSPILDVKNSDTKSGTKPEQEAMLTKQDVSAEESMENKNQCHNVNTSNLKQNTNDQSNINSNQNVGFAASFSQNDLVDVHDPYQAAPSGLMQEDPADNVGICHILTPNTRCLVANFCINCHTQCTPCFMSCSHARNLCKCQLQRKLEKEQYDYVLCCCFCMKNAIELERWPDVLVSIRCKNHYQPVALETHGQNFQFSHYSHNSNPDLHQVQHSHHIENPNNNMNLNMKNNPRNRNNNTNVNPNNNTNVNPNNNTNVNPNNNNNTNVNPNNNTNVNPNNNTNVNPYNNTNVNPNNNTHVNPNNNTNVNPNNNTNVNPNNNTNVNPNNNKVSSDRINDSTLEIGANLLAHTILSRNALAAASTRQRRITANLNRKSSTQLNKELFSGNIDKLLYKIYKRLVDFKQRLADEDVDGEVKCEWQQVAMVLDRLMFLVFFAGTLIILIAIYGQLPTYDDHNVEETLLPGHHD